MTFSADFKAAVASLRYNLSKYSTILSLLTLGGIVLLVAESFMNWQLWAVQETTIQFRLGHVQIRHPDFLTRYRADPYSVLIDPGLAKTLPPQILDKIKFIDPELAVSGLLVAGERQYPLNLDGVNQKTYAAKKFAIPAGRALQPDDYAAFAMGAGLAARVPLSLGERYSLVAKTAIQGVNAAEFDYVGEFETHRVSYDASTIRAPLKWLQNLVHTDHVHMIKIHLHNTEDTDWVLGEIRAWQKNQNTQLEVLPWYQLDAFYTQTAEFFRSQLTAMRLILVLTLFLGSLNLLVLSINERRGEIGILKALGFSRARLFTRWLMEIGVVAFLAGVLVIVIGWPICELINWYGVPMPPAPGMRTGYTAGIRVEAIVLIRCVVLLWLAGVVGALLPMSWIIDQKPLKLMQARQL